MRQKTPGGGTTQHRRRVCSKWVPQRHRKKIYGTKTSTDRLKRTRRTESHGVVTIPYLKGLSEQFRRSHATDTLFELLSNLEERLKRLNAHVKSHLVKGRNVLCKDFLCRPENCVCRRNMAPFPNKEERTHGQSQRNK